MNQTVLTLYGVWGEQAREAVSRALNEVSGVMEVRVNMYRAEAVIVHDGRCAPGDLVAAVSAAGRGWFYARAVRPPHPHPIPSPSESQRSKP